MITLNLISPPVEDVNTFKLVECQIRVRLCEQPHRLEVLRRSALQTQAGVLPLLFHYFQ